MNKKRIIIFLLVIGFVFLFWSSSLLQEYFQEGTIFLENYGQIHPLLSVLVFIGLSALSAMLMSFSSIWLVPAAVVLWNNHLTATMLLISWLIGATASYFIGKYGGYSIVHRLVSEKKISYYQHLIKDKLNFWVIFLFRLTLPSEIPGYLLGIARYPFWKYLLITFLAEAPYALYAVYAIDSVLEEDRTMFAITAFIWFVVVWVLTYFYMRKVKKNTLA